MSLNVYFGLCESHVSAECRRDQDKGGKLDSQEEASPEEIKSREVVLGQIGRES